MRKVLVSVLLVFCLLPCFVFADDSSSSVPSTSVAMDTDSIESQIDQNSDNIKNVFDHLFDPFFDLWENSTGLSSVALFFTDSLSWIPVEFWYVMAFGLGLALVSKAVKEMGK